MLDVLMSCFERHYANGGDAEGGKSDDAGNSGDGIDELGKGYSEGFHYLVAVRRC